MNVLFTIVIFAVLGLWAMAAHSRLLRFRNQVKRDWKNLDAHLKSRHEALAGPEGDPKDGKIEHARNAYNDAVIKYNEALQVFPANVLGGLAGFQAAKEFEQR